jgi:hypothetical protein
MKPTGRTVAEAAMAGAERVPPILYTEEDCQGFVENTVKRAGGSIPDYRGSNDMYRNACSKIVPLKGASLEPGMVLFIVKQDGGEPDRYKPDGLGNASHIGWYTGGRYEVVHSSASRGSVQLSTLKNGWTHAGWLRSVDYDRGGDEVKDYIIQGSKGQDVKEFQQMLIDLGYSLAPYGADGDFGPVTRAAVESFQVDNGLRVTGVWMDADREKAMYLLNEIQDFPPVAEPVDTRALLLEMRAAAERNIQIIDAVLEGLV